MANFISEMSGGLKFEEQKKYAILRSRTLSSSTFCLKEQAESSKEN